MVATSRLPGPIWSLLLAVSIWLAPAVARGIGACTCHQAFAVPATVTGSAPLNLRIFVSLQGTDPRTLRLLQGSEEVPIDVTPAGGGELHAWVTPRATLQPRTRYRLVVERLPDGPIPEGTIDLSSFDTVGVSGAAGLDRSAPRASGLRFDPAVGVPLCGGATAGARLALGDYRDDFATDAILQLDITVGDQVERIFLRRPAHLSHEFLGIGGALEEGRDCLGDRRLPRGELGESYQVRAMIWDWSGNSATLDAPLTLTAVPLPTGPPAPAPPPPTLAEPPRTGCATAGAVPAPERGASLAWTAALVVLGFSSIRARRFWLARNRER